MPPPVTREILGVPVLILRRPQKNMYLRVLPDGTLRVTCPPATADAEIDRFVESQADWLRRRRGAALTRAREERSGYGDGSLIPLWGRKLVLTLADGRPFGAADGGDQLILRAPQDSTPDERAALIRRFRRAQLSAAVPPLLRKWQPELGVRASGWRMREMTSRWGSCNTRTGALCFNLRLTEKDPQCLEYVVVHELSHLIVPNHSPAFWNCVARCLPDWRKLRALTNSG